MQNSKCKTASHKPTVIFLVGPTAIGKTETALYLAKKINAEIISCDSMQIYKGMDIITSKPAITVRKRVCHYLIDIVSPVKQYNVVNYRREAVKKIKEILRKGKMPLFVGGTGLYMSVVIDGIFKARSEDKNIRQRLYKEVEDFGSKYLYKRLKDLDPEAAIKIHPHDTRRIVRALEVQEATGKTISCLQKQRKGLGNKYDLRIFCLNIDRDRLCKKIENRVECMFKKGLIREVKKLLKLRLSKTAAAAIGIKELKGYFYGLYGLEEAKRLIKRNTRLNAKRQMTWFRKDKRIEWVEVGNKEKLTSLANRILKILTVNK